MNLKGAAHIIGAIITGAIIAVATTFAPLFFDGFGFQGRDGICVVC